jgi:glutamine synthetase
VNGSGKHNNWSLGTDDGQNLLEPGRTPAENEQFLIFVSAMIMAVDRHADKLRASCGNPGNDLRLGANEAPPAIISIFMGDEFTEILEGIAKGKKVENRGQHFVHVGVDSLPQLPKDNTDRNRTSPFAFTGNKFEFRMVGSSASISGPNIVINTIVSEALDEIATRLEKAGKAGLHKEATAIVRNAMKKHGRIIFNGNNYSDGWVAEAKKRGLPNIPTGVEALASMASPEAVKLFEKYKVLSEGELHARYEIYLEHYVKHVNIEARAAVHMVKRQYLPAVIQFTQDLAKTVSELKSAGVPSKVQKGLLGEVSELLESAQEKLVALESSIEKAHAVKDLVKRAEAFRDKVVVAARELRKDIDALEGLTPANLWPVPTYAEMLFKL